MRAFAIVPAAGRSRRMGQPKLLLPWGNATVIEAVLAAWRSSRVSAVVSVLHSADERLAARCRAAGVEVVTPDPPPAEMRDSVQAGLEWVARTRQPLADDVWMLAPADMPTLTAEAIDAVLNADAERDRIVIPTHGGRRGHPVRFPWALADEVTRLAPDEGLNQLARRHPVQEVSVETPAVLNDLDTRADYERLLQQNTRKIRPKIDPPGAK